MPKETDRKLSVAAPDTIYPRFMAHRIMRRSIERMKMRFILVAFLQKSDENQRMPTGILIGKRLDGIAFAESDLNIFSTSFAVLG